MSTHANEEVTKGPLTSSVMIMLTQREPVKGREHLSRIFGFPFLSQWSVTTMTLVSSGEDTRSIAPPMPVQSKTTPVSLRPFVVTGGDTELPNPPLTSLPGMIQL